MKTRLNEKKASELKPADNGYEIRDEIVRGLILRVGKKGQKVWEVVLHVGKRRHRERLGTYPAVSVKEARRRAETAKENIVSFRAGGGPKTVSDIFEAYKVARSNEMRTWHDVQSVWDVWSRDRIGHVRVADLNAHHGLDLRSHVAKNSSPLRAGAVIRYLRPMFNWAVDEQMIEANPWAGIKVGVTAQSRDRVLSESEWRSIWAATFQLEYPFGPFTRALMLTAQRLNNVAQMQWDEIQDDLWTIPRAKMKATKSYRAAAHEVPFSKDASNLISALPIRGPFVFTTTGDKPIHPGSKIKAKLQYLSGTSDWRFHDIRRSAATIMTTGNACGKANRFIVERVLGHADTSVTAIYDRATYRNEKREALEVLAKSVQPSL